MSHGGELSLDCTELRVCNQQPLISGSVHLVCMDTVCTRIVTLLIFYTHIIH